MCIRREGIGRVGIFNLMFSIFVVIGFLINPDFQTAQAQNCSSTPVIAGYRDFNYGSTVISTPTAEKPESKLWWNNGFWWGSLWDPSTNKYRIHRFDVANQCWLNVGPDIDDRSKSLADALWDDATQKLYIASHLTSSSASRLYRYSFNASLNTYSLDSGFPVNINNSSAETLTLAKDSTGKLWITWENSGKIWVNRSTTNDLTWGSAFQLPVQGNTVASDDISAILSFSGNQIGVMWSNQIDKKMYFAVHIDGNGDTTWQPREDALADANLGAVADDHVNLKISNDGSGTVYAVTKSSLTGTEAPLIYVLKRDANGSWISFVAGKKKDGHTRPIIIIDEENRKLYMFAKSDKVTNGTIRMKSTSLDNINFVDGVGEVFIRSTTDNDINSPTSTKQNVNSVTGLLVLASDQGRRNYLHNFIQITPGTPTPDITVTPSSFNYGSVVVGSSSANIFEVKNVGTADLVVSSTTLIGTNASEFSIASGGGSFTLTPNQTHNITVNFNPTSTGAKTATLQISSNDPDENPFDVALSGTGATLTPDITVTPTLHNYGNVVINTSSSKTFVVKNDGTADLTVTSTTLIGTDAAEFSIDSGGAPFTLTPSQSRNVVVSFNPTSTGAKSATLRIDSDDPDENPFDVSLPGTGVDNPPPGGGNVVFEESQTGGSSNLNNVSTASNLTAVSGHLYLAAISTKPKFNVTSVAGLGLTWTLVRAQCAGRNQIGIEVWMAQGNPSGNGAVSATLSGVPKNAVIVVNRYSGADAANPIGALVSGNSNGTNGSCSGGVDGSSYSLNLTTGVSDAVVYGAVAMRERTHTPGAGYTERAEIVQGGSGSGAGLAVEDKTVASASTVTVDGSFNSTVDWAAVGLEIKPQGSAPKLAADPVQETPVATKSIPDNFELFNVYPNPFNAETTIEFALPQDDDVRLSVYNLLGQLVRELVNERQPAGYLKVHWDGRNTFGQVVASGIYLVRLQAGRQNLTTKITLQK